MVIAQCIMLHTIIFQNVQILICNNHNKIILMFLHKLKATLNFNHSYLIDYFYLQVVCNKVMWLCKNQQLCTCVSIVPKMTQFIISWYNMFISYANQDHAQTKDHLQAKLLHVFLCRKSIAVNDFPPQCVKEVFQRLTFTNTLQNVNIYHVK